MNRHKNLSADTIRRMPWKSQLGLVGSELARAEGLAAQGGGPEVAGCLERARELLGVAESCGSAPPDQGLELARISEELGASRLGEAPAKAGALYRRIMALYLRS